MILLKTVRMPYLKAKFLQEEAKNPELESLEQTLREELDKKHCRVKIQASN
jgi:hypothetical protein